MTMRASLIITAKDQASRTFNQVAGSAKRMGAAFKPVSEAAQTADRSIDKVGNGAWSRFARVGASARKMASDMRIAERAAYGLGAAIGITINRSAKFAWGAAKFGIAGAAAGAAAGAGMFLGGIISNASKFEQYQAQLEGTEGSAEKAKKSLDWVAKFAANTPYEIDQVTDAFVRARGVGIEPFSGAMTKMGDAAAANRKTLMDTVEAIADAQTGEFERLKEFNITSSVKGDQVTFSFLDKAGKNAVRVSKKNAADIQRTILSIWDERHGGAMIRQSKTFEGIWRNLLDWVTLFQLRIAGKGIFDKIKSDLAGVLDLANRLADDGTLDRWATTISDGLKKAWDWGSRLVKETDWQKFGSDLMTIAKAAWSTALAFAKIVEAGSSVPWVGSRLVTEPLTQWRKGPEKPPAGTKAPIDAKDPWWKIISLERAPAGKPKQAPPPARRLPAGTTAPARTSAADVKVGGKVQIEVAAAPGTQVRTRALSSNNRDVPISVRTGKTMAGGV